MMRRARRRRRQQQQQQETAVEDQQSKVLDEVSALVFSALDVSGFRSLSGWIGGCGVQTEAGGSDAHIALWLCVVAFWDFGVDDPLRLRHFIHRLHVDAVGHRIAPRFLRCWDCFRVFASGSSHPCSCHCASHPPRKHLFPVRAAANIRGKEEGAVLFKDCKVSGLAIGSWNQDPLAWTCTTALKCVSPTLTDIGILIIYLVREWSSGHNTL